MATIQEAAKLVVTKKKGRRTNIGLQLIECIGDLGRIEYISTEDRRQQKELAKQYGGGKKC